MDCKDIETRHLTYISDVCDSILIRPAFTHNISTFDTKTKLVVQHLHEPCKPTLWTIAILWRHRYVIANQNN